MLLKSIARKGATEIIPHGRLDIDQAEVFEKDFLKNLHETKEKTIGINLNNVEYIDSSGLGVLIKVLNEAKNRGIGLTLYGASPKIQNVFQLARLEKFFTFSTKVEFQSKYPSSEDEELDELLK